MKTYNDVFVEELVVRQPRSQIILTKAAIVVAGIIVLFAVYFGIGMINPDFVSSIFPLLILGIIVGCYFIFRVVGKEYEYSFYSGDVDIEKITGKRKRTKELSFNCKDIELMAPYGPQYDSQLQGHYEIKLDARGSGKGQKDWFIVCRSEEGKKALMVFSPSERLIGAFKQFTRGGKIKE